MNNLSWEIDEPMRLSIKCNGTTVMWISIAEIIETSSRKDVLRHVKICDNTPWLRRWNNEKYDATIDILNGVNNDK